MLMKVCRYLAGACALALLAMGRPYTATLVGGKIVYTAP